MIGEDESNCKLELAIKIDKEYVVKGDIITFEVYVYNKYNLDLDSEDGDNIKIINMLSKELEFVLGSVKIDDNMAYDENILSGVNINIKEKDEYKQISFKAKVIDDSKEIIINKAICTYNYRINNNIYSDIIESNNIIINLEKVQVSIDKKLDKKNVSLYEEVQCTITINNCSNIDILNVQFKEDICDALELLDKAILSNGKIVRNVDLLKGVYLGNIKAKECMIISYKVKVIKPYYSSFIVSKTEVDYNYRLKNKVLCKKRILSDKTMDSILNMNIANFKQGNIENNICISAENPLINEINNIYASIDILNCHVITTSKSKSNEGQVLSGYKLIVNCIVEEVVEYTTYDEYESLHSEQYRFPFSTYIILEEDFDMESKFEIKGIAEDISFKKVSKECFYQNIVFLIVTNIYKP
ncbi:MAG: hypothetical protein ACRDA3_07970 [Peptostreptococcaceae bacterium]